MARRKSRQSSGAVRHGPTVDVDCKLWAFKDIFAFAIAQTYLRDFEPIVLFKNIFAFAIVAQAHFQEFELIVDSVKNHQELLVISVHPTSTGPG